MLVFPKGYNDFRPGPAFGSGFFLRGSGEILLFIILNMNFSKAAFPLL